MNNSPLTNSVYEQILAEFLRQLEMDFEAPHALVAGLRRLVEQGKMGDSAAIQKVLASSLRGDDATA